MVTVVLTVVAMVVTSPLLALALLVAVPTVVLPTRWCWRSLPDAMTRSSTPGPGWRRRCTSRRRGRAPSTRSGSSSAVAGDDAALVAGVDRERDLHALHVRWIPSLEVSHMLPLAVMLALGASAYADGSRRSAR